MCCGVNQSLYDHIHGWWSAYLPSFYADSGRSKETSLVERAHPEECLGGAAVEGRLELPELCDKGIEEVLQLKGDYQNTIEDQFVV